MHPQDLIDEQTSNNAAFACTMTYHVTSTYYKFLPPASEGCGQVLFSVCQSTPGGGGTRFQVRGSTPSQVWGGYPVSGPGGGYPVSALGRYLVSGLGGTPSQVWGGIPSQVWGGTPSQVWGGYPISGPRRGTPSQVRGNPPLTNQHSELLLHGGQYASCVHAGGLSCINCFCLIYLYFRTILEL